jgi:hypothetical protein
MRNSERVTAPGSEFERSLNHDLACPKPDNKRRFQSLRIHKFLLQWGLKGQEPVQMWDWQNFSFPSIPEVLKSYTLFSATLVPI